MFIEGISIYSATITFIVFKGTVDITRQIAPQTRLQFHLAHKLGDEESLMKAHATLRDVPEDQLCLASVHYLRAHYQEAIDVYKKLLLERR